MPITQTQLNETISQLRLQLQFFSTSTKSDDNVIKQYSEQVGNVEDILTRTLKIGESNSCLIIGPRGSGKTTVVNSLLRKLDEDGILGEGTIVKLTGLLQTDDRLALQEITKQMRLETEAAGKVFSSFAENLSFLLESLKSGSKEKNKSVVFILEEFDLFCHHKNQTLLYNLFDIAQSAQAPICVIGLTCRLDVIELLEKRVKSRFSHRQLYLFPSTSYNPEFVDIIKSILYLNSNSKLNQKYVNSWNVGIDSLLNDKDAEDIFKYYHELNGDVRSLKMLLILAISNLNMKESILTTKMLTRANQILMMDAKTTLLKDLSILQLSLIVAMKHIATIYEGEPFNFEMVYREYLKFVQKRTSIQSFDRPVVFKAFDQLQCLELIRRIDNSRGMQKEHQLVQLMISPNDIVDAMNSMSGLPTDLNYWLTSYVN